MLTVEDIMVALRKSQVEIDEAGPQSLPNRKGFVYNRLSDPAQVKRSKESLQETASLVTLAKCDGYKTGIEPAAVEEWLKSIQKNIEHKGVWEDHNLIIDIRDLGISGQLSSDKREGLAHLIRRLESGEVGCLYLTEGVSRLSRDKDRIMPFTLLKKLKDQKCCVRTPEGIWNPAIPRDWDYLAAEFEDASKELAVLGRRLYRRRRNSAAKGNFAGEPVVLGYFLPMVGQDPDGKYKFGKMIPYEPHAELVRMIIKESVNQEGSWQKTAQALTNTVIPFFEPEFAYMDHFSVLRQCTKLPNGYRITPALVKGLAKNPKLIGIGHWGDTEPIENNHEPIVSDDLFLRAYDMASAKGKPRGKTVHLEPLVFSGLLRCYNHNESVLISSNRKEERYRCAREYRAGEGHHCLVIRDHLVDGPLASVILGQLDFTPYSEEVLAKLETDAVQIKVEKTQYRRQISELEQKLENLRLHLGCGDPEREKVYWGLYQETQNSLKELNAKPPSNGKKTTSVDIGRVRQFLSSVNENWQGYSRSQRNRLMRLVIDRINLWHQDRQIEAEIIWKNGFRQSVTIGLPKVNNAADKSWTSEERNLLKLSWPGSSKEDVEALLPERSYMAIQSQAHKMGLKRQVGHTSRDYHAPWTDTEELKAKKLWESGLGAEEIAKIVGRGKNGITRKARGRGWQRPKGFRSKGSVILWASSDLEVLHGLPSQGR